MIKPYNLYLNSFVKILRKPRFITRAGEQLDARE